MMLAVAAFAVSVSSVQAFGNYELLTRAGLSDEQVVAVQEARELRRSGDLIAARDTLIDAGIDEEVVKKLRQAHRDFNAQQKRSHGAWMYDQLTVEQQQALHVARSANDRQTVRAIMAEVGIELPQKGQYR